VVNLYLVALGARRAYLFGSLNNKVTEEIEDVAQVLDLHILYLPENGLLMSKEEILYEQVRTTLGLAEVLGYCIDPNFLEVKPGTFGRIGYFVELVTSEQTVRITQFVCTRGYYPSQEFLEDMRERFQEAINYINPDWRVRIRLRMA
jgi:hypothetical protein